MMMEIRRIQAQAVHHHRHRHHHQAVVAAAVVVVEVQAMMNVLHHQVITNHPRRKLKFKQLFCLCSIIIQV